MVIYLLKHFLLNYLKNIIKVHTLINGKANQITAVDQEHFHVKTDNSIGTEKIPIEAVETELTYLLDNRSIQKEDLSFQFRSSFILALLNQLPFVRFDRSTKTLYIEEFKTDQLPYEQFHKTMKFLDEVIDGQYDPTQLNQQLEGNEYQFKTNARQDLRMLGFLSESNEMNESIIQQYKSSSNQTLVKQINKHPYFAIVLEFLDRMNGYSVREKKQVLVELAMTIVRNSRGENLMKESVAKKRTTNLIYYLKGVGLVDEQLNVTSEGELRTLLEKVLSEYITERNSFFKENPLGQYVRGQAPEIIKSLGFVDRNQYNVKGSVGQGNWAQVPWISILDKSVTASTQEGYYLVYLFSEDMEKVYLSFAQGITNTPKHKIEEIREDIRQTINTDKYYTSSPIRKDNNIYLGNGDKAKGYVESTALYIEYEKDNLPSEFMLQQDLEAMLDIYQYYTASKSQVEYEDQAIEVEGWSEEKVIDHIHSYIEGKGFFYKKEDVKNLFLSLRTKPFVILSGISGTGKTKVMELFAESIGANEDNNRFSLIPVRPDWSDSSDLLGYVDIKGEFQTGPLTQVIERAHEDKGKPYFVVLDEMNLARVEYYFSDFLSVIESRKWRDGEIKTSLILPEEQSGKRLTIPPNLYIVGTVNMDETTHPFSKKVLDRANTIEFNDVHLDHFGFIDTSGSLEMIELPNDRMTPQYLNLKDAFAKHEDLIREVTNELVQLNKILEPLQAHVGYRVRDEVCFYLIYSRYLLSVNEALDYQILQKILPRLTASHGQAFDVLKNVFEFCTNHVYEEDMTYEQKEDVLERARFKKSARKVYEMLQRGEVDGFTSFWMG